MPKTTESVIFSDAEREILELALQNPGLSNSDIADQTGYRLTLVRDTRRQYEDDTTLPEGVAEQSTDEHTAVVGADLNDIQQEILDLVAENPRITNAEIAEKTGARVALVRDTRDTYGDQIETQPVDEDDTEIDTAPSGPGEPSAAQQAILEAAADDPSLSNAELADQTDSRITLVRDTLAQYDGPRDSGGEPDTAATAVAADVDTSGYSEAQTAILEAAAANPEATNRELAEQTGSRVTLVRDTLAAEAADDKAEAVDNGGSESEDQTDVLEAVDTAAFSGAQLRILEVALSNPELTNAEIAEQTDSRVTLVRDTIYEHEYDEKPWVGNVEESDDSDDSDDEIIVDSDDEIEIPDTTASDLFNDRQRAILETALETPELTNAEIAEQTGARLALVRDTRETYEGGVELAAGDDGETTTSSSSSSTTVPFSEKQNEIIAAAEADEEASIADIADQTGARIPLVRDTLAAAEDRDIETGAVEADGVDDAAPAEDASTVDDAATATDSAAAEPASDDGSTIDDGGVSDGVLVAIVIAIILLVGIAVLLL